VSDATLRCVAGSHLWDRPVLPIRWVSEQSFYPDAERYLPVPDPEAEGMRILEWPMEPGDAIAFHFSTLHGARANMGVSRRRVFSVRYLGDDARFVERPGRTSPPFPGHGMVNGQRLRADWFPAVPVS
jgi:ectoine hydroxylase-related dioxygenase (phytanoyl-CoA dioxygenase family)